MGTDIDAKRDHWVKALGEHEGFTYETRWFDGSILIEVGGSRTWIKVYRGRIIDHLDHVPVFGYTVKLTGSPGAWEMLASGERTFSDLVTAGSRHLASYADPLIEGGGYRAPEIAIEGDGFAAGRLHVGLWHLAQSFAETFAPTPVSA